jgi:ketosteroid isomerase-like protein
MITTDPATVVTRYIHAVRDGDTEVIRASFAEDATWEYPGDLPLSGTWRGRDTIVNDFLGGLGTLFEAGESPAIELTSILAAGGQVVAEWTSRATARGGAAYHNRNIGVFTVRDGKITSIREYTDTQHAAHVLFGQHRDAAVQ